MPDQFYRLTPRELSKFAKIQGRINLVERKNTRFETAIVCTYLANMFREKGKPARQVKEIHKGMKIKDPEEEKEKVRAYRGSLSSQIDQHKEWLEGQEHGSHK